jgi:hypothetical protein
MKETTYTIREKEAIAAANRVVIRSFKNRQWEDVEFFPLQDETLLECISRVQKIRKTDKEHARGILYLGSGESYAALPIQYIPQEVIKIINENK